MTPVDPKYYVNYEIQGRPDKFQVGPYDSHAADYHVHAITEYEWIHTVYKTTKRDEDRVLIDRDYRRQHGAFLE